MGGRTDVSSTRPSPAPGVADQPGIIDREPLLQALFEEAPIGKAVVAPDGRWLKVNRALCLLLGIEREDLLSGRFQDITHPADLDSDMALVDACLTGERDGYELDKRYIRPDGTTIWTTIYVALVRDESGRPSYFITQVRDISDRIAAQQRLERALAESEAARATLERADEMKDHLLSITSHELRTPLTSILGFSKTLSDRWADIEDSSRREAVGRIHRQAQRLKGMIDDLLLLSAAQAGRLVWRPSPTPTSEIAARLERRYGDVTVRDDAALTVDVDIEHLFGALDRLVVNARQHGAGEVDVSLTTAATDADADADGKAGTELVICVRDHGDGVPKAFQPMLFRQFEQADTGLTREVQGPGLGLAAVATIVGAAGGTIWYEAAQPGARFCLRLPTAS